MQSPTLWGLSKPLGAFSGAAAGLRCMAWGRPLLPGDLRVLQAPWYPETVRRMQSPGGAWGGKQTLSTLPARTHLTAPLAVPGFLVNHLGVKVAGFKFFPCYPMACVGTDSRTCSGFGKEVEPEGSEVWDGERLTHGAHRRCPL